MTKVKRITIKNIYKSKIEPLTIKEVKLYLRLDSVVDDIIVQKIITAARIAGENYTRISLVQSRLLLTAYNYVDNEISLPLGPVSEIESVILVDRYDARSNLAKNFYYFDEEEQSLVFKSTLISPKILIRYHAGFSPGDLPEDLKQAMLIHIASLYESRIGNETIPAAAKSLYQPYKIMKI